MHRISQWLLCHNAGSAPANSHDLAPANARLRKRIVDIGVEPMGGTPQDFARYMDKEISKWEDVAGVSRAQID